METSRRSSRADLNNSSRDNRAGQSSPVRQRAAGEAGPAGRSGSYFKQAGIFSGVQTTRIMPPSAHRIFQPFRNPVVLGTLCGLVSAVGYTAANICLRAVSDCDPIWVSCVKAFPTVVLVAPWLILRAHRGEHILPDARVLASLVLAGLLGQLMGNVLFQWSLGIVGIALTVPLTLGTMIVFGAVLGRVALREPVTPQAALSMVFLILAICSLSLGAGAAHRAVSHSGQSELASSAAWLVVAGVAAAGSAGMAYAVLGVVIRYGVSGRASLSTTLFTVSLVGLLSLGGLSFLRIGATEMGNTDLHDLDIMLRAGICNALAFLALTKALQLTSVVYFNALNATQATMAAIAGVLLFGEPLSPALATGIALTIAGLLLVRSRPRETETY
jgi:drug/metabolite transporter (DMT)-like permease